MAAMGQTATKRSRKVVDSGQNDAGEAPQMPLPAAKRTVLIDRAQLLALLGDLARDCGTRAELARRLGVSGQFIGDVLAGKKKPGAKLLHALGAKAVTMYELEMEGTSDE